MPSSVTGFFNSGSITRPSASVICSREGCAINRTVAAAAWRKQSPPDSRVDPPPERGFAAREAHDGEERLKKRGKSRLRCGENERSVHKEGVVGEPEVPPRSKAEQLPQVQAVPHRKALPVVVEVGVDVGAAVTPAGDPPGSLLQLALRVVAASPSASVMEADERPVGRQLESAEGGRRAVRDHQSGAVLSQEHVALLHVPARLAELEAVAPLGKRRERRGQPLVVPLERRRQLPEHRPEPRRAPERLDALVEAPDAAFEVRQPPDVRQVAARLDREHEAGRRVSDPALDRRDVGEPVEGRVELDGVEELCVVLEPALRGESFRVDALAPVGVVPARAPDPDLRHINRISARRSRNSFVGAATTAGWCAVPSGAASQELPSAKAMSRPHSRTTSWAAATSTARAPRREQTASSRPAANWQSESASEPVIR